MTLKCQNNLVKKVPWIHNNSYTDQTVINITKKNDRKKNPNKKCHGDNWHNLTQTPIFAAALEM